MSFVGAPVVLRLLGLQVAAARELNPGVRPLVHRIHEIEQGAFRWTHRVICLSS
jgi:hypothetical protein